MSLSFVVCRVLPLLIVTCVLPREELYASEKAPVFAKEITGEGRNVFDDFENRFPIVLAHGLLSSRTLFSLGKAASHLRAAGFQAFVTEVSGATSIRRRGHQLADQVDAILRYTGANDVHIVGHSMGGLDARYLISSLGYGDKIASLTTIATPHRGSPTAETVLRDLERRHWWPRLIVEVFVSLYNFHSWPWNTDLRAAVENLTPRFLERFNRENPNDPRVHYASWAGRSQKGSRQGRLHRILHESYETVKEREGDNDGLVSVASAQWGDFRGTVAADHITQIGAGRPSIQLHFSFRDLFLRIAERVAAWEVL